MSDDQESERPEMDIDAIVILYEKHPEWFKNISVSKNDGWSVQLEEACYQVARGKFSGDGGGCSLKHWQEKILPDVPRMEAHHGVRIRGVGDARGISIEVARYQWIFDLDDAIPKGPLRHAITGVLLGYDAPSIDGYMRKCAEEYAQGATSTCEED